MRLSCVVILTLVALASTACNSKTESTSDKSSNTEHHYFGQTPPGMIPEVFAPDVVSTDNRDMAASFSPDLNELYFMRKNNVDDTWSEIHFVYENNDWTETVAKRDLGTPLFSPDGNTMHYGHRYRLRIETGWSEAKAFSAPFDTIRIMRMSESIKGTLAFDEIGSRSGDGILRYSRLVDGEREDPKPFNESINTRTWNAHPFIAADESFVIWDGERESGFGDSDLYISFQREDGSWGDAINMGEPINTAASETGGYVSPDGKYLFFDRKAGPKDTDIFWVDIAIIETLRPN